MPNEDIALQQTSLTVSPHDTGWLEQNEPITDVQTRKLYERLTALYTLAEKVYASGDYSSISCLALDFFQALLKPERAILAIQPPEGVLSVHCRNVDAGEDPGCWPISQNLLQRVRTGHVAVLSTDAREDAALAQFESIGLLNIRSVLCVPLGRAQSPRGLIYLDSRMQTGVFDRDDLYFLTTVCRLLDAAIESIDRANEQARQAERAHKQIEMLKQELFEKHSVVGRSKPLLDAYEQLKNIAKKTDLPILLRGESGTGKELFARAAHYSSSRQEGPFVAVSLAAVSPELVESELFGHMQGAFTGATSDREGLLDQADGGTLFLDEVADVPPHAQAKLLRVLQEKTYTRVGSSEPLRSDFRLISATSRRVEAMAAEGAYREDLLNRLEGIAIFLPPLRERPDDIPMLVEHFLNQAKMPARFSEAAMQFLMRQPLPGNVRQLQHCVVAAAAMAEADTIGVRDIELVLRSDRRPAQGESEDLGNVAEVLKKTECAHMIRALDRTKGNAAQAARLIGMSKASFSEKRKRYGI
ncbi:MAG: sigma 54-interacting transcriptional regulator [bacterium]